ncbi:MULTISPECIES: hypothetical protein [Ralstonia]|jgi:hypothetical protein|nr:MULTISPECIES: hypothetical protein [Ralstonia]MCM3581927.1 hypothetical protein [Ralstonia pickettii]
MQNYSVEAGDIDQLAGRMYECVDVRRAIEGGEFKTLADVLAHVSERGSALNARLRPLMASSVRSVPKA